MQTVEKKETEKQLITLDLKDKKTKNTNKISQETTNEIFYNILFAIVAMIYFNLLILAKAGMAMERLEKDIQVFAGIFMLAGIFFTEKAYKQDKGTRVITAIECFVLSIHSLSIQYIVKKYGFDFSIYLGASAYIFASYCTLKAIIIYTKGRKQLLNDLSDVKEIVQKEEPIKKEASKKVKDNDVVNKEITEGEKTKSKQTKKKTTKSKTATTNKTTTNKTATKKSSSSKSTNKKASTTSKEKADKKELEQKETKTKKSTTTAKKGSNTKKAPAKKSTNTKKKVAKEVEKGE